MAQINKRRECTACRFFAGCEAARGGKACELFEQKVEIAVCNRRCRTCAYSFGDTGTWGGDIFCGYLIRTGKRRPCPAGKGCTVYKPKRRTEA